MYYMYLVARHSGNDEFNAAYAQEDGGSFTSDAFIWAGEKIQDWVKKGYVNEGYNSLTTDNGEDRALLYNNTCAMMLQGSWNVRNFVNDSKEWTDANLGVFRFPEDAEAREKGVPQNVEIGTAIGHGHNNGTGDVPSTRYTPYHVPHRTEIDGFMSILHGDCRFYNNIFVQKPIRPGMQAIHEVMKDSEWTDCNLITGTNPYSGYPTEEEYLAMFTGYCGMGADVPRDMYYRKLPVWFGGNVYFNDAKPATQETNAIIDPEQYYENPDGTPIVFCLDYFGGRRDIHPLPGPFAEAEAAKKVLW